MIATRLCIWILIFASIGCAFSHVRPSKEIRTAFDSVDVIEVGDVWITHLEVIRRLKAIHARSKWDPVPTTLPVDIITIYGGTNGVRKFKLVYGVGWLMDTNDKGEIIRLGTLNDDDRKWMEENIRSLLPPMRNVI